MYEKSHVSLEQKKCIVCGKDYDTNTILLDRRMKASMNKYTLTGWGMCPEHQQKYDEGYIALVAVDPKKSKIPSSGPIAKQEDVYRTGTIAHIKEHVFVQIMNAPSRDKESRMYPMMFCEPDVVEKLQAMSETSRRRRESSR